MQKRRLMIIAAISLAIVYLSSGCNELTQSEIKFLETREVDLPYDEAYQAAINGLFSLGYTIEHSDKESGVVSGRRNKKAAKMSVTFLLILPLPTVGEGSNEEAITFLITRQEPDVSLLRMKVVINGKPVANRELMTEIWQRIEREAMLETRPREQNEKGKSE